MKHSTSSARILAAGILLSVAGAAAAQQAYPTKPIRIIVPYPPGGAIDPLVRLIGPKLTESWGQPAIVDNRPGGNSIIGTDAVAKAPPDGYTFVVVSPPFVITPLLMPTPYDAIKDFAPLATISSSAYVLVVHPSVSASNLQEFIALAKSRPGQLNYASAGSGSPIHLAGEFFNMLAGIKMQHIPYKGGGPAMAATLSGQVQLQFATPITALAHIKSRKLNALAYASETRSPVLPNVPTFSEAGLPGLDVKPWYGALAPAGTPKDIVNKLSAEIAKIVGIPALKERLASLGMEPFISTPDQFAALLKADIAKYGRIIKTANVKIEN